MRLIGLIGKAGSGKTYIANYLVEKYGFTNLSFAKPLKDILVSSGILTKEECYTNKTSKSRFLLQQIGTNIIRYEVDFDFFIKRMKQRLLQEVFFNKKTDIVIDDIRFNNETFLIMTIGGTLVKVKKLNEKGEEIIDKKINNHESEQIDLLYSDYIITAKEGDLDSLIQQIEIVLSNMGRRINSSQ